MKDRAVLRGTRKGCAFGYERSLDTSRWAGAHPCHSVEICWVQQFITLLEKQFNSANSQIHSTQLLSNPLLQLNEKRWLRCFIVNIRYSRNLLPNWVFQEQEDSTASELWHRNTHNSQIIKYHQRAQRLLPSAAPYRFVNNLNKAYPFLRTSGWNHCIYRILVSCTMYEACTFSSFI